MIFFSLEPTGRNFANTGRPIDSSSANESSVSLLFNVSSLAINGEVLAMVQHETSARKIIHF